MDFATNPIDGAQIAYRGLGTGTPIVLVHGTALSQAIWRGFGYVRDLGADHRVITLDLRGHGRSDKPHDPPAYRMELFVADVLAVLDELGVDRAHYLGYSLGGRVGFSLASTHPERMLRFASAGGAPRIGGGSFDRVFFPGAIATLEAEGMDGFSAGLERRHGEPVDVATRAAFAANDPLALAAYMRESEQDAGVPDSALAGIRVPTLLLAGTRDEERLRSAEAALAVLPNASLRVLDGATHGDTLRHPDALPAVREFFDGD